LASGCENKTYFNTKKKIVSKTSFDFVDSNQKYELKSFLRLDLKQQFEFTNDNLVSGEKECGNGGSFGL